MKGLGNNNTSMRSLKFPGGISKINKGKGMLEDTQSFLEDIEQIENTIIQAPDMYFGSKLSNLDENKTLKGIHQLLSNKKKKKRRNKKRRKKTRKTKIGESAALNEQKMLHFLKLGNLAKKDSLMSGLGNFGISGLINGQTPEKISELASETDSEIEFETNPSKKAINQVIYHNDIGKIDQKISVSNYTCSCTIF